MSSSLEGRVAVVFGVANKRSIAWSIAQGLHAAGMKLAITYQNERLEQEAKDLILSLPGAEAPLGPGRGVRVLRIHQSRPRGEADRPESSGHGRGQVNFPGRPDRRSNF